MQWFLDHNPDVRDHVDMSRKTKHGPRLLLTIANRKKLERIYRYVFDEKEFLSPHGIRALSKFHAANPFMLHVDGQTHSVDYEPGESTSDLFGGNSNWRGPVWFPMNFLLIESMQRIHYYYGDEFKVECPVGFGQANDAVGGRQRTLAPAEPYFSCGATARRAASTATLALFQDDPHWRDLILFYEYFLTPASREPAHALQAQAIKRVGVRPCRKCLSRNKASARQFSSPAPTASLRVRAAT